MKLTKIGEFLNRSKIPVDILDDEHYNRVTIRINHNGVSLRDNEIGKKIGTKKQFGKKPPQTRSFALNPPSSIKHTRDIPSF